MKRGLGARGYTLLEVMIVLAISGGLLTTAMLMISGQRQRTEFSQAIKDVESQIQDVINDVSTGYYANTGNFACDGTTGRPRLQTVSGDTQGRNRDCIFLGRVMQFGVSGSDREGYSVYNVIGLKQFLDGATYRQSENFFQAKPTAMSPGSGSTSSFPSSTDSRKLKYGLRVSSVRVGSQSVGAIGFFGTLAPYGSSGGNLVSGAQTVEVAAIPSTSLDMTEVGAIDAINRLDTAAVSTNPASGITLCFQSGGTNEYGLITIGSNGRQLSTKLDIRSGTCP